jgi:MinD-like ATPase involved in chromosome partitioning or flagellar assembly
VADEQTGYDRAVPLPTEAPVFSYAPPEEPRAAEAPVAVEPQAPTVPPPRPGTFDADQLLRNRPAAPTGGLRRVLWRVSGGRISFAPTGGDQAREALHARVRTPAASGRRRIAMISLKGGVGKTTTTVMLGHTLASLRGDNVIAVDANPDAGNLVQRVRRQTDQTARDLLDARGTLGRYADVRRYTSQADSRLEVLAGESDPALSEAFSARDYQAVLGALERFYSVILTDCGTGILHDAMRAVLFYVDQLVVVTSPAVDSARALSQLLDWLDQHGYHHLVESAIVVVNGVRKRSEIRVDQFAATFGPRCRSVVTIPYDPALSTGGESSPASLLPATREAYLQLAAAVGDGFGVPRLHGRDPETDPS